MLSIDLKTNLETLSIFNKKITCVLVGYFGRYTSEHFKSSCLLMHLMNRKTVVFFDSVSLFCSEQSNIMKNVH